MCCGAANLSILSGKELEGHARTAQNQAGLLHKISGRKVRDAPRLMKAWLWSGPHQLLERPSLDAAWPRTTEPFVTTTSPRPVILSAQITGCQVAGFAPKLGCKP
jgi:hypothetical protein